MGVLGSAVAGGVTSVPLSPTEALRKNLFVDTFALSRALSTEGGLSRDQADRLTALLTQLLCDHKERLSMSYVDQGYLKSVLMEQEGKIHAVRSDLSKSQELSLGQVQTAVGVSQQDIKTMRVEMKHELDKLQSTQRLDFNLERGNTREEIRKISEIETEREQRFERELNVLRTQLEASKNDMIKWFVGMMSSVILVTASLLRMLGKW